MRRWIMDRAPIPVASISGVSKDYLPTNQLYFLKTHERIILKKKRFSQESHNDQQKRNYKHGPSHSLKWFHEFIMSVVSN